MSDSIVNQSEMVHALAMLYVEKHLNDDTTPEGLAAFYCEVSARISEIFSQTMLDALRKHR